MYSVYHRPWPPRDGDKPSAGNDRKRRRRMIGPKLNVQPLDTGASFRTRAYLALKPASTEMAIYDPQGELRLDERKLRERLGVNRTQRHEALTLMGRERRDERRVGKE